MNKSNQNITYCKSLKIDAELCIDKIAILKDIETDFHPRRFMIWKKWNNKSTIFYEYFISYLQNLNCQIFFAELFYTPPYTNSFWHIDTASPSNFVKLNFVWGSRNHEMQWGESKQDGYKLEKKTMIGTKYLQFPNSEIILCEKKIINRPTLVNIGVPHRVVNFDSVGRYCLSVILHDLAGNRISMTDAILMFNEYVVD